jgi:hypothetical protein
MTVFASLIALFLLLLLALLVIPIQLSFNIRWREGLNGECSLLWLFGLVRARLPVKVSAQPPEGKAHRPAAHPARGTAQRIFRILGQRPLRDRIIRFIRQSWGAIKKSDLYLHLRLGLGDPAETGQLWALLGPFSGLLSTLRGARIELVPDFLDAGFELQSRGTIRFIPLQLLYLMAGLLLSPALWRAIRRSDSQTGRAAPAR